MMKVQGIFRVTSHGAEVRKFETHMSQENYIALQREQDPHIVSNYFKRVLREMKEPLIPYSLYYKFAQLSDISTEEGKVYRIQELVAKMDLQRQRTLHFIIKFFEEVVFYET